MQDNHRELVNGARSVCTKTAVSLHPGAVDLSGVLDGAKDMVGRAGQAGSAIARTAGGVLGAAAPGVLAGAGVGLAGSLMSEEQRKHKLRNMLLGGVAGGGIAAGAGMLHAQHTRPPAATPQ